MNHDCPSRLHTGHPPNPLTLREGGFLAALGMTGVVARNDGGHPSKRPYAARRGIPRSARNDMGMLGMTWGVATRGRLLE